jgi:hypothetical protein
MFSAFVMFVLIIGAAEVQTDAELRMLEEVVGVYQGTHRDWRDTVTIMPDGTFIRGNGEPGTWAYDGYRLYLDWTNWGDALLERQPDGTFFNSAQPFRLVQFPDRLIASCRTGLCQTSHPLRSRSCPVRLATFASETRGYNLVLTS